LTQKTLDGWDAIADHLQKVSGIARSTRTIQNWSRAAADPMPVYKTPGGRDVYAVAEELEAWWKRWCAQALRRERLRAQEEG
jgi:hypothetical protein